MILSKLPDSRFSTIGREWEGRTAILLGGGVSLSPAQFALARSAHDANTAQVIAINDAYLCAPWADVLYAADQHWWKWHSVGMAKPALDLTAEEVRLQFESFGGERCSIWNTSHPLPDSGVHLLRNYSGDVNSYGLSGDPEKLVTGWHGGFQALNLAILAGVRKVILLGYDGKSTDGRQHWHGGHPRATSDSKFEQFLKAYSAAESAIEAAGVTVINCSLGSAINSFVKMEFEQALAV